MMTLYKEFEGKEYLDQWERVQRWYEKVLLVKSGYYKDFSDRELLDIVYSYFMNVQHLKDWVWNWESADSELKRKINELQKKKCFIICSDFINNHKHFKRHPKSKFVDSESAIKNQSVKVSISPIKLNFSLHAEVLEKAESKFSQKYSPGAKYYWCVEHLEEKIDVFELAKECLDEWFYFFQNNRLV